MSTQHTPGSVRVEGSLCLPFTSYPAAEKCWLCPRDFSRGMKGGGASEHPPGTSSPDPAAPKGRALARDLLLQGPLRGTTLRSLFKMQISEPSPVGPTPLSFHQALQWLRSPEVGSLPPNPELLDGYRWPAREDADRQLAQRQGEKPQGKAPGFHQQRELWAFKPPGCPQLGRDFRRLLQNSACCLTTVYFLSSSFTGCQLSAFLFFSLSPTLSSSRALSLDKRATETERMESELELKNGPLDQAPPQPHKLNPSLLFSTRKQP